MTTDPDEMYNSPVITVIGWLVVLVPALALVALVYWVGQFMGGWLLGGVMSVVTSGLFVWAVWDRARRKRGR